MRIFLTGGSGLLGSKLAEIAKEGGHEIYSGYCHNLPEIGVPVELDLAKPDQASLSKIILGIMEDLRIDLIIHSAALTDVDKCEMDKDLASRINILGTKAISEAAKKVGAFLIYVSTDYVFDGEMGGYSEEDKTNPISYYGYTKLMGERYCQDFCIARTCVIYGARPASGKVNFALWMAEKLRNGEKIKIVTDQYITPTLNTNLAKMILDAGERRLSGIYHMAGATRISRYEFAREMARIFGYDEGFIIPSRMSDMKWKARRPVDSSLDTSKAARSLKESPADIEISLKMLKEELAW